MAITRREVLKGLAVSAVGTSIGSSLPLSGLAGPQAPTNEIDELIAHSIV
ncbi:MAG: twin-arginine translocation signal domain-containing protein, partial [Candidatus Acidiferrales bacterium]